MADLLFEHPSPGEVDVEHPVDVEQLGDRSTGHYYEFDTEVLGGTATVRGHVLQVEVGRTGFYVATINTATAPELSEAESLARVICERLP